MKNSFWWIEGVPMCASLCRRRKQMQRKCKQNAKLSSPGASDVAQCGKITVDPGSVTTTAWDKLGCGDDHCPGSDKE